MLLGLEYWTAQVKSRQLEALKMGTEHQSLQLEQWLRQREERRVRKRRARLRQRRRLEAAGEAREWPTVVSMCRQASGLSLERISTHS